jgi:prevent-host-death family protein
MNAVWQIQDAKNKLSEVITRALTQGPQVITKHGEKTVVVVSYAEYEKLRKSQGKLSDFFRASPLAGVDLDLTRDKSLPREGIEL